MMESASANLIEFIDMKKFIDPYNVIKVNKNIQSNILNLIIIFIFILQRNLNGFVLKMKKFKNLSNITKKYRFYSIVIIFEYN